MVVNLSILMAADDAGLDFRVVVGVFIFGAFDITIGAVGIAVALTAIGAGVTGATVFPAGVEEITSIGRAIVGLFVAATAIGNNATGTAATGATVKSGMEVEMIPAVEAKNWWTDLSSKFPSS